MVKATELKLELIPDINEIPARDWNALAGSNPFVNHAFLAALETSGSVAAETGWQPYHMCLRDEDSILVGAVPLYVKSHSYGEYVFDHAWANAYENAGGSYYPKLQSSIPFTPVTGPRLLVKHNDAHIKSQLLLGVAAAAEKLSISSSHLTFIEDVEAKLAEENGFLVRHAQQFHWQNDGYDTFDDFLQDLSSRKRKQIRKERRTATENGITIRWLQGADITDAHWDAFFEFYLDTGARKWGQPYLNKEFFQTIGETMPESIVLFLCERDGNPIAGALNLIGGGTLYGRYWGCIEDHPCLHFEACYYQAIDYAIKHRLKTVEAGAQGEHKLARGYVPTTTYSAHWIVNEGFRDAVANFLRQEKHQIAFEAKILSKHTPFKKG
ncbi:N-acetyltransferase [Kordiimonas sp. SCSIO 12603]|uniref:GNAT family N-acetyltransferase n=1 Tax=Kordiimonas sp. SCSIO 12603 TaxID=2829596 RepID=UPI002102CA83|nr:GNAT family N-acetyltransferase [Kordiimonas sp. SCSIO 12603]UTW57018.1 N-acetyltransferase [Kordiimonas sp. SCSIO 12603]